MTVSTLWRGNMLLGEGPCWDEARQVLWLVDIKSRRVHRYDPADGQVASWRAPEQIGWILPSEGGRLLTGLQSGLALFDPENGTFDHIAAIETHLAANRLNDATVGPDGAVWFGSMDDDEAAQSGRVYRWDGVTAEQTSIAPVTITNGPGLSPDGRTLYHVDTLGGLIHAVAVDADGVTGTVREFARIDPADGTPDGVTVDAAANVWVGLWGGWRARLYAPDGSILREVRLPAANVTKIALGGPDLKTAYATTARVGIEDADLADQPDAGGLFGFAVDVPGQSFPPARCAAA